MSDTTAISLSAPNMVWKHALATPLTILRLSLDQAVQHAAHHQLLLSLLQQALKQLEYVTSLLYRQVSQPWLLRATLKGTVQRLDCHPLRQVKLIDNLQGEVTFPTCALDFQEALSCAITNAWEAYEDVDCALVLVSVYSKNRQILLQIQDYGQGITRLTLHRILGRGTSTKGPGRGLGTRFIRQVIEEQLHGRIIYTSYLGIGTTQTWLFPMPDNDSHTL